MRRDQAPCATLSSEVQALLNLIRYLRQQSATTLPQPEWVDELLGLVESELVAELDAAGDKQLN